MNNTETELDLQHKVLETSDATALLIELWNDNRRANARFMQSVRRQRIRAVIVDSIIEGRHERAKRRRLEREAVVLLSSLRGTPSDATTK